MNAPEPSKRFYENATVRAGEGGFVVMLDARTLKTPMGTPFTAPTRALAEACAKEWAAQGERILPTSMPLTRLAFAAVDHTRAHRAEIVVFVAKYAETDLCCHRAAAPAGLIARQAQAWDPLVAWGREAHGIDLAVVTGVIAAHVAAPSIARVRDIAAGMDDFHLTALAQATGLAGSILIGLALHDGRLDAEAAFAATTVDEAWSVANWGEDAEAAARLERMKAEFGALGRFIAATAA